MHANTQRAGIFHRFSNFYHFVFGQSLEQGRARVATILAEFSASGPQKTLEVGVGTGLTFRHYPKGTELHGIDLHEPMLEKARKRAPEFPELRVTLEQMDATHLSFADASFDVVYAPSVLSVVNDAGAVLSEMIRVCKPGGYLIIICYARKPSLASRSIAAVAGPITEKYFGFHMRFSADMLKQNPQLKLLTEEETNFIGILPLSDLFVLKKRSSF